MSTGSQGRDEAPRPTSALSWPKRWQTVMTFLLLVAFVMAAVGVLRDLFGGALGASTLVSAVVAVVLLALLLWLDRKRQRAWARLAAGGEAPSGPSGTNRLAAWIGDLRWARPWQTVLWWIAVLTCSLVGTLLLREVLLGAAPNWVQLVLLALLALAIVAAVWLHRVRRRQQAAGPQSASAPAA